MWLFLCVPPLSPVLCLLLLRTETSGHLPSLPCQCPTSWVLLFLAVGLSLALSSLPKLNSWDPKPHVPASTGLDPLVSLPRLLSLLAICSGQAPLLPLLFSSRTVDSALTTSPWVALRFEADGIWTTNPLSHYTHSAISSRGTYCPSGQKPCHLGSPHSARGWRVLELLMPLF